MHATEILQSISLSTKKTHIATIRILRLLRIQSHPNRSQQPLKYLILILTEKTFESTVI